MAGWWARVWRVVAVAVMVGLAAACGSDSDDEAGSSNDGGEPAEGDDDGGAGEAGQDEAGQDGGNAVEVGEAPELDPSAMPPPGEARVEVDGQIFVFRQSEMIEGAFTCEVRDDGITINFQSDRHDMLLQGVVQEDGTILASTTVVPEESDFRYDSSNAGGNEGGVAVEGNQVLYVSRFDATPKDDLAAFEDVGQGSVAVTCP